jgi:hypothetical protein
MVSMEQQAHKVLLAQRVHKDQPEQMVSMEQQVLKVLKALKV